MGGTEKARKIKSLEKQEARAWYTQQHDVEQVRAEWVELPVQTDLLALPFHHTSGRSVRKRRLQISTPRATFTSCLGCQEGSWASIDK